MYTWRRISITKRITLFAGVLAVLLSALLTVTVMTAFHRYATDSLQDELTAAGGRLISLVERGEAFRPMVQRHDRVVQVVDARGAVVAASPSLQGKPVMAAFPMDGRKLSTSVVCGGAFLADECDLVVGQQAHPDGEPWIVYVASPVIPFWVTPWLAATVVGAAAVVAAAVTLLAHRISTNSLRPVTRIQSELDRMNDVTLDRRVPVPCSKDEIHDLAVTVNRTLSRLQAAMAQQRHFTSDASHELRTPIAAIQAEVEDALHAPDETTVPGLGTKVLNSVERLRAIVDDLLIIARLEAGRFVEREPVDLSELVAAECRRRQGTSAKTVECSLERDVTVLGDRTELSRLLVKLIDNADRYAESKVTVRACRVPATKQESESFPDGVAVVDVIDDGPGIDASHRELVFQRFARLDTARDRDAGGTGLGLAIARQVAAVHGGTLHVTDAPRGAHFVLRLPALPHDHTV
ncbi:Signal transduction histidine kinase [Nonomuraea maritima]|uniref:histidine kinase n=1 Tax=Nonomuraea maritima TaxID=683260 RepID=A0A1G9RN80_9ACTN|nr:HAMP domain-containing sensor histidine kinase [Nonomuraea maritima]SDM24664.1 Signal transduction histidine kinase [Nonomuraea maritima]